MNELSGIVPGAPLVPVDVQVTTQPLFLPGTIEAEIQDYITARGWSWSLVRVVAERHEALLIRDGEEHPEACRMDTKPLRMSGNDQ